MRLAPGSLSLLALLPLLAGLGCGKGEPTPPATVAPAGRSVSPADPTDPRTEAFERARDEACAILLQQLRQALLIYRVERGRYPSALTELSHELSPMVRKRGLADPWGRPVSFVPGEGGGFRLCSAGRDGTPGNDDDICQTEPD